MTTNKLTDERTIGARIAALLVADSVPLSDAWKALIDDAERAELQERRKADGPEPVAWTERCEITNMQSTGLYLRGFPNNSQGRDIALYTAPQPAPDSEAQATLKRLAVIFHGSEVDLNLLTVTAQSLMDRCKAGNSPVTHDGLIAAVNRLLDSDGSRGCYSSIRCHSAREEVERLLATYPQIAKPVTER